jgi:hypothetical protein
VRAGSAGATHKLTDHCHEGNMRFSFGYQLTEAVRERHSRHATHRSAGSFESPCQRFCTIRVKEA